MELAIGLILVYFIPSINAFWKGKRNKTAVLTLNFFLGWTVIGWIVALIWSSTNDAPAAVVIEKHAPAKTAAEEVAHLFDLKQKGALTEEEFQEKKKKLLS